jgi:MoxR-like ATPase
MMEITIALPQEKAVAVALMADTKFHDVDALLGSLAPTTIAFQDLAAAAARIQSQVLASADLLDYAWRLWRATLEPQSVGVVLEGIDMSRLMLAGASPRGMSMLLRAARVAAWLQGRLFVTPEDVHGVFEPVVAHRLVFQPLYEMRRHEIAPLFTRAILDAVAAP